MDILEGVSQQWEPWVCDLTFCLLPPRSTHEDGVHSKENALGLSQLLCVLRPTVEAERLRPVTFPRHSARHSLATLTTNMPTCGWKTKPQKRK